jgi:hypothetical protein
MAKILATSLLGMLILLSLAALPATLTVATVKLVVAALFAFASALAVRNHVRDLLDGIFG